MFSSISTISMFISIHAPVKGATFSLGSFAFLASYFNPRSREGSDIPSAICTITASQHYFNPRSREGSDLANRSGKTKLTDFNPRSREGSDCLSLKIISECRVFQSTLP